MNLSNNNGHFSGKPKEAAPVTKPAQFGSVHRIPKGFKEAMEYISMQRTGGSGAKSAYDSAKAPTSRVKAAVRWRSTFKPLDDQEDNPPDQSTTSSSSSPTRVELYDPYNPASSDSENETPRGHDASRSQADQSDRLERQRSSSRGGSYDERRWDSPYPEPARPYLERHDLSQENRPSETRSLSPVHRLAEQRAYSPEAEGYGSLTRLQDHGIGSPDRPPRGSPTSRLPESYGAQRTSVDERITFPEYQREMNDTGRLCPTGLREDHQHHLRRAESDGILPSTEVNRNRSKSIIMDKNPISCELCFVELANGQELQDHLESKTHWDTLEHIQRENNYDDLNIAFLQEVMLHKSRKCSRAIEDSVRLKTLCENNHMTKIEIFHCAACNVFVSTSASSMKTHIASEDHIRNKKEFEVQQRLACLDKAETMMMELKPQFERFLKGDGVFE